MSSIALRKHDTVSRTDFWHCETNIRMDWRKLVWVFTVMSVVGLVGETLQHYLFFGEWQTRAGFVWGPFSPIYGAAALILTVVLEPLASRTLLVFVAAALVGGGLEYYAGWAMEEYWGVVAWSYEGNPFNINGHIDLFHTCLWGVLGLAWVKIGLPIANWCFEKLALDSKLYTGLTTLLLVFLLLDGITTANALYRADERAHDIPAAGVVEQYYDTFYPDDLLRAHFNNMGGLGLKK